MQPQEEVDAKIDRERAPGRLKISGDMARSAITNLQESAVMLKRVVPGLDPGHAIRAEPIVNLLWHLADLTRTAELEMARLLKEVREAE